MAELGWCCVQQQPGSVCSCNLCILVVVGACDHVAVWLTGLAWFSVAAANPERSCIAPAGVPDSRPLQEGDVLNVDVTAYLGGYHGDTNATFCVGA
jgi:hypothetical protein